jgi:hypothetical protein
MLSADGTPLSTLGSKKASWYLKKCLAFEAPCHEGYSKTIQLLFNPPIRTAITPFSVIPKENRCVRCGRTKRLTLHHVIPYCVKKHFPQEHKGHSSEWCVLLCVNCHLKAEQFSRPLFAEIQYKVKERRFEHPNHRINLARIAFYKLKIIWGLELLPEWIINEFLSLAFWSSVDCIPNSHGQLRKRMLRTNYYDFSKEANLKFIEQSGGVDGVKKIFREAFMKTEPKFLSKGFLEIE